VLSADDFGADTAELYGWINRSLPDAELDAYVDQLARRISTFDATAIATTKQLLGKRLAPPTEADFKDGMHGFTVESVTTSADVTMGRDDRGPAILAIHLNVQAKVPGATKETFQDLATRAKVECAFSKVLRVDVTMDATLMP